MHKPRRALSKEAREHLHNKLDRMKGLEKKKTVKRLEMYDRGQRRKQWDKGPSMERE